MRGILTGLAGDEFFRVDRFSDRVGRSIGSIGRRLAGVGQDGKGIAQELGIPDSRVVGGLGQHPDVAGGGGGADQAFAPREVGATPAVRVAKAAGGGAQHEPLAADEPDQREAVLHQRGGGLDDGLENVGAAAGGVRGPCQLQQACHGPVQPHR